jgi:hypothetical protein
MAFLSIPDPDSIDDGAYVPKWLLSYVAETHRTLDLAKAALFEYENAKQAPLRCSFKGNQSENHDKGPMFEDIQSNLQRDILFLAKTPIMRNSEKSSKYFTCERKPKKKPCNIGVTPKIVVSNIESKSKVHAQQNKVLGREDFHYSEGSSLQNVNDETSIESATYCEDFPNNIELRSFIKESVEATSFKSLAKLKEMKGYATSTENDKHLQALDIDRNIIQGTHRHEIRKMDMIEVNNNQEKVDLIKYIDLMSEFRSISISGKNKDENFRRSPLENQDIEDRSIVSTSSKCQDNNNWKCQENDILVDYYDYSGSLYRIESKTSDELKDDNLFDIQGCNGLENKEDSEASQSSRHHDIYHIVAQGLRGSKDNYPDLELTKTSSSEFSYPFCLRSEGELCETSSFEDDIGSSPHCATIFVNHDTLKPQDTYSHESKVTSTTLPITLHFSSDQVEHFTIFYKPSSFNEACKENSRNSHQRCWRELFCENVHLWLSDERQVIPMHHTFNCESVISFIPHEITTSCSDRTPRSFLPIYYIRKLLHALQKEEQGGIEY